MSYSRWLFRKALFFERLDTACWHLTWHYRSNARATVSWGWLFIRVDYWPRPGYDFHWKIKTLVASYNGIHWSAGNGEYPGFEG